MTKTSAWLAIAFGVSLSVLEALRNWGDWQWWPFWVVDYIAAGLLVLGGTLALRRGVDRWLTAGWGFACAMFWMSFVGHLETVLAGGLDPREKQLTTIIGALFGLTIVGLGLGLIGRRKTPD